MSGEFITQAVLDLLAGRSAQRVPPSEPSRPRGGQCLPWAERARRERVAELYEFWMAGGKTSGRSRYTGKFERGDWQFNQREFLRRFGSELIGRSVQNLRDEAAAKEQLKRFCRKRTNSIAMRRWARLARAARAKS